MNSYHYNLNQCFAATVSRHGGRPALRYEEREIGYRELAGLAERMTQWLPNSRMRRAV